MPDTPTESFTPTCTFCDDPAAFTVEFHRDDGPRTNYCLDHFEKAGRDGRVPEEETGVKSA